MYSRALTAFKVWPLWVESLSFIAIANREAAWRSRSSITPEQVAREISAMTASMRTTHLVLGMHQPGLEPAKSQKSMELFAKEVRPALH